MEIKDLKSVLMVAECHNFTEAAFRLSYTTSAISKHVHRVEEELGVSLFDRSNKQNDVTLTKSGRILIKGIGRLVKDYVNLLSMAESMRRKESVEHILQIGYPVLIGTFGEMQIISDFSRDNPDINLVQTITNSNGLINFVMRDRLDGAFVLIIGNIKLADYFSRHPGWENLDIIHCATYQGMYLGVSSKSPWAQKKSVSLLDLKDEVFAFWKDRYNPTQNEPAVPISNTMSTFTAYWKRVGIEPKVKYFDSVGQNVFHLAAEGKIVLPVARVGLLYSGVRFVRVKDWENTSRLIFISLKNNDLNELKKLKQFIQKQPINPDDEALYSLD